jgi:hypothetical protein
MGGGETDRLIRDAEQLRADLIKLAGAVGAWTEELAHRSGVLRSHQVVREGSEGDDPGESGGRPDPDSR